MKNHNRKISKSALSLAELIIVFVLLGIIASVGYSVINPLKFSDLKIKAGIYSVYKLLNRANFELTEGYKRLLDFGEYECAPGIRLNPANRLGYVMYIYQCLDVNGDGYVDMRPNQEFEKMKAQCDEPGAESCRYNFLRLANNYFTGSANESLVNTLIAQESSLKDPICPGIHFADSVLEYKALSDSIIPTQTPSNCYNSFNSLNTSIAGAFNSNAPSVRGYCIDLSNKLNVISDVNCESSNLSTNEPNFVTTGGVKFYSFENIPGPSIGYAPSIRQITVNIDVSGETNIYPFVILEDGAVIPQGDLLTDVGLMKFNILRINKETKETSVLYPEGIPYSYAACYSGSKYFDGGSASRCPGYGKLSECDSPYECEINIIKPF